MRLLLTRAGLAGVVLLAAQACATPTPTSTYTVAVAGVVTATGPSGYALDRGTGLVSIDRFIQDGPPAVGDLLLAGEGSPTWGYAAVDLYPGCWVVFLNGSGAGVDGDWIDADTGKTILLPAVDVHLRIPKSPGFDSPVGADGRLVGRSLCLDREGRVASAH